MLKGLEMLSIKEGDITNYINTLFNSPFMATKTIL